MCTPHEWIIGASAGCDIVVEEPTVSGRHCRLLWQEGGYQLDDLGSTNGTFVNDVQLTKARTVTRDDRITLGKTVPFPWSQVQYPLADPHKPPVGRTTAPANAVTAQDESRWQHLPTVFSASALIIVLTLGAFLLRGGGTGTHTPTASTVAPAATDMTPLVTPEKVDAAVERSEALPRDSARTGIAVAAQQPASPRVKPDDPANSLYCLVVGDIRDTQRYRLGTACAIDAHRLLTSASIVSAVEQLADRFPKFVAISIDQATTLQARSCKVHPEFAKAAAEVGVLKQRLAALQGSDASLSGAGQNKTAIEGGDHAAAEIAQLHERGLELAKTMLIYDIAVLEFSETLPFTLTVNAWTRPSEGEPLTLLGLPADNESLFLDSKTPLTIGHEVATASVPPTGGKDDGRLYAKCPAEQVSLNWAGSPLVNNKNQVVAVYCRPSPADDPLAPPLKDRLEAAWADAERGL